MPDALDSAWALPVAGETYDGFLNDINGHHVTFEHVAQAMESAASGPIEEGSVGGGTGMIPSASRRDLAPRHGWSSGRAHATRSASSCSRISATARNLTIRGMRAAPDLAKPAVIQEGRRAEKSSIIAIVATDAPLIPHQLKRLAKRVPLGIALTGGFGYHSSGDIFLAFSTANAEAAAGASGKLAQAAYVPDIDIDRFFDATVQATEEAILNSLTTNEDMTGRDGNFVPALPREWLRRRFGG